MCRRQICLVCAVISYAGACSGRFARFSSIHAYIVGYHLRWFCIRSSAVDDQEIFYSWDILRLKLLYLVLGCDQDYLTCSSMRRVKLCEFTPVTTCSTADLEYAESITVLIS